jgi:ribosomal protein L15
VQTTIGQLNFFKWAIDNGVIDYVEQHHTDIEADMNCRNSTSKKKQLIASGAIDNKKTRKKREELSVSASKSIKKENVEIVVSFD